MQIDFGQALVDALLATALLAIPAAIYFYVVAGNLRGVRRVTPAQLGRWWAGWTGAFAILGSVRYLHHHPEAYFYQLAMVLIGLVPTAFVAGVIWRKLNPLSATSAFEPRKSQAPPGEAAVATQLAISPERRATISSQDIAPGHNAGTHPRETPRPPTMEESFARAYPHTRAISTMPSTSPMPPLPAESSPSSLDADEAYFDQVGQELDSGQTMRSTWTRAYAEADGDDKKARAIYIRLRVARLKEEHAEAVRLRREQEAEAERVRLELERAEHERSALMELERTRIGQKSPDERVESDAFAFRRYVRAGNTEAISRMLAEEPHFIFLQTPEGNSMLQLAVGEHAPSVVKLLIEHGARDWPDRTGYTALRFARELGEASSVQLLERVQPTAGETYDAARAALPKARGTYRGKVVELLMGGDVRVQGFPRPFESVQEATATVDRALGGSGNATEPAPSVKTRRSDVSEAAAEAMEFGLSDETIAYLGDPIMAVRYVKKYGVTPKKVSDAIEVGKIRGAMHKGVLWVEDKPID